MTVTIALHPDEQKKLTDRAAAAGRNVTEYVHDLIHRDIEAAGSILGTAEPIARAVAASGISEEELDTFFEQSRQEVWEQKGANRAEPL